MTACICALVFALTWEDTYHVTVFPGHEAIVAGSTSAGYSSSNAEHAASPSGGDAADTADDTNRLPVIAGQRRDEGSEGANGGASGGGEAAGTAIPRVADIAPEDAPDPQLPHDSQVVIARLSSGADAAQVNAVLAQADGLASRVVTDRDVQHGFAVLPLAEGVEIGQAMAQLEYVPGVEGAQPDYEYVVQDDDATPSAQEPSGVSLQGEALAATDLASQDDDSDSDKATIDDPRASEQWALDSIHAYEAWAKVKAQDEETGAPKVIVAILDNGCLVDHEDLKDNVVDTYNAAAAGQAKESGTDGGSELSATSAAALKDVAPFIDNHGTHVAGIVAARANNGKGVAGVSYNAGLLPVQVFRKLKNGGNTARVSDIALAYDYLMAYNADESHEAKVKVANFSLGVDGSDVTLDEEDTLLVQKVGQAHQAGILTVLSSGNSGSSGAYLNYPSDWLPDELSVINLQEGTSGGAPTRASSSNYNMKDQVTKDIAAPGQSILSTGKVSTSDYATKNGTSMAAPCVAGVAALVFAANPNLSSSNVAEILCATATDLGDEGWDVEYGAGEVNAAEAVASAPAFVDGPTVLLVGDTAQLTPSLEGEWTWQSGDRSIVSVNEDGLMAGVGPGVTTVSATFGNGNFYARKVITVYDVSFGGAQASQPLQVPYGGSASVVFREKPDTGLWYIGIDNPNVATMQLDAKTNTVTVRGATLGQTSLTANLAGISSLAVKRAVTVVPASINVASATLTQQFTFTGAKRTPKPTLTHANFMGTGQARTLKEGVDYTLSYKNNLHAGTASVTVTGKGNYTGTRTLSFKIVKAANPMKAKTTAKKVKRSLLKKKTRTVKGAITFSVKPRGTVTYTKVASGSSRRLAVNKKTGKITVKRNTPAGTYRIRVRVKAAGTADYKSKTQIVTAKICVK